MKIWDDMRDYQTEVDMCEAYNLYDRTVHASVPGEVHRHLKEADVLENDVLFRFEHLN